MDNNKDMLKQLIPRLVDIFQETAVNIILYGSVARGTQTEESDIDVAVLVKPYTKEMHNQMIEIDYDTFKKWENIMPFYKNVKKEGIVLWPAA